MTEVLLTDADVGQAWILARAAAQAAKVSIVDHLNDTGIRQAQAVIKQVWGTTDSASMVAAEILHAFIHSGSYVGLAVSDGEPVGAAVGFLGRDADGLFLHSHIAGVLRGMQGR